MRFTNDGKIFWATDLSMHSECEHRSVLEMGVVLRKWDRPGQSEIRTELLEMRGREHEARVYAHYDSQGQRIATVSARPGEEGRAAAIAETESLMRAGAGVIYQGALRHGDWFGKPDFLVRAPGSSRFGSFHYEAVDAKLARETKARAVLQLCVYTELLAKVQDRAPEKFWIAPGTVPVELQELRADDFMAYFRRVRAEFETFAGGAPAADVTASAVPYPDPVEHCAICPWWKQCEDRRRTDDHLSLVAGITRRHRERLPRQPPQHSQHPPQQRLRRVRLPLREVPPRHRNAQRRERLVRAPRGREEPRTLVPGIRVFGFGDVQRDAAGSTHQLIRQGAVVPLDANDQRPKRRNQLDTERRNDERHDELLPPATRERTWPPAARGGRVKAARERSELAPAKQARP
jgi:hypothetical protein